MKYKVFVQTTLDDGSGQNVNDWDEDIIDTVEAENEEQALKLAIRADVENLLHEGKGLIPSPKVEHIDIDKAANKIYFSYNFSENYYDEVKVEKI